MPIAEKTIAAAGLSHRITVSSGDYFAEQLPRADVSVMGRILHDWNPRAEETPHQEPRLIPATR